MKNLLRSLRDLFLKPSVRIGLGVLVTGGFIAGVLAWQGFNTAMEATNKEEFCLSCHTMHDNLLPELQKTVHWNNRTGVRARCPDCHVPHDFTDKMARKMQASREVLGQLIGTIDTREKFKEHRLVLAQREWKRFSPTARRNAAPAMTTRTWTSRRCARPRRSRCARLPSATRAVSTATRASPTSSPR